MDPVIRDPSWQTMIALIERMSMLLLELGTSFSRTQRV